MAGQGPGGQDGNTMPMPNDVPMPSEEETEKMFKELMKMQFNMNPDELGSDNEESKAEESSLSQ